MKNLIFLFMGFFCLASSQTDSIRIVQKLNQLEQTNLQTTKLIKKLDKVEAENKTLIYKIKLYIKKLTDRKQITLGAIEKATRN